MADWQRTFAPPLQVLLQLAGKDEHGKRALSLVITIFRFLDIVYIPWTCCSFLVRFLLDNESNYLDKCYDKFRVMLLIRNCY